MRKVGHHWAAPRTVPRQHLACTWRLRCASLQAQLDVETSRREKLQAALEERRERQRQQAEETKQVERQFNERFSSSPAKTPGRLRILAAQEMRLKETPPSFRNGRTSFPWAPADPTDAEQLHAAVLQAIAEKHIQAENIDDAAFALGAVWGDALCAAEGLEWVALEDGHALAPAKKKSKAPPRRVFEELRALMLA